MKMRMNSTLLIVGCLAGCAAPSNHGSESTVASPHALQGPHGGLKPHGPKVKVSKELALDTPPVLSPGHAHGSAAAFGGAQYLVVWSDFRGTRPALYGARVALDGTVLDPYGILILDNPAPPFWLPAEYEPAGVSFDGTNFLVVAEVNGEIRGARVSASGAALDPGGFLIAGAGGNKYQRILRLRRVRRRRFHRVVAGGIDAWRPVLDRSVRGQGEPLRRGGVELRHLREARARGRRRSHVNRRWQGAGRLHALPAGGTLQRASCAGAGHQDARRSVGSDGILRCPQRR